MPKQRRTWKRTGTRPARESCTAYLTAPNGREISVPYTLFRSDRTTASIEIDSEGNVKLRVPYRTSEKEIQALLEKRTEWILRHLVDAARRREQAPQGAAQKAAQEAAQERRALYEESVRRLRPLLAERIAFYEPLLPAGHRPITRVSIHDQKTRWGSCSAKGTLCFNWRLSLVDSECIDYVVVHELCHLVHLNHSPEFWALVESILPDWEARRDRMKEYASTLDWTKVK